MSESGTKMDRRQFLKLLRNAGAAGAAVAIGAPIAKNLGQEYSQERESYSNEILRDEATYIPHYESHFRTSPEKLGISAFPQHTHYFREVTGYIADLKDPNKNLRAALVDKMVGFNLQNLQEHLTNETELQFADIELGAFMYEDLLPLLAFIGLQFFEKENASVSRRVFLRMIAAFTGSLVLVKSSKLIRSTALLDQSNPLFNDLDQSSAAFWATITKKDFTSIKINFRDNYMAQALILMNEKSDHHPNEKKTLYAVGAAHNGIESRLRAGRDACHSQMLALPNFILQTIINNNGGLDSFCTYVTTKIEPGEEQLSPNQIMQYKAPRKLVFDEELKQKLIAKGITT